MNSEACFDILAVNNNGQQPLHDKGNDGVATQQFHLAAQQRSCSQSTQQPSQQVPQTIVARTQYHQRKKEEAIDFADDDNVVLNIDSFLIKGSRDKDSYCDFLRASADQVQHHLSISKKHKQDGTRSGVAMAFPIKLYKMLLSVETEATSNSNSEDIVAWAKHGRCFTVLNTKLFTSEILPRYFKQSKVTSFQRQLSLYGFQRISTGLDRGAYFHQLFLRCRPDLAKIMLRTGVKGGFPVAVREINESNLSKNLSDFPSCPTLSTGSFDDEHSSTSNTANSNVQVRTVHGQGRYQMKNSTTVSTGSNDGTNVMLPSFQSTVSRPQTIEPRRMSMPTLNQLDQQYPTYFNTLQYPHPTTQQPDSQFDQQLFIISPGSNGELANCEKSQEQQQVCAGNAIYNNILGNGNENNSILQQMKAEHSVPMTSFQNISPHSQVPLQGNVVSQSHSFCSPPMTQQQYVQGTHSQDFRSLQMPRRLSAPTVLTCTNSTATSSHLQRIVEPISEDARDTAHQFATYCEIPTTVNVNVAKKSFRPYKSSTSSMASNPTVSTKASSSSESSSISTTLLKPQLDSPPLDAERSSTSVPSPIFASPAGDWFDIVDDEMLDEVIIREDTLRLGDWYNNIT